MNNNIAIHNQQYGFTQRWVEYCINNNIKYEVINCLENSMVNKISKFNILLWHWAHNVQSDMLAAKAIINSAELMGLKVYPNIATCWHFDDKIAQKYLLEAIGAPIVPTYVFYSMTDAFEWLEKAQFPLVFKLSKGAGSANVHLIQNIREARNLVKKAFTKGFQQEGGYFTDSRKKIKLMDRRRDYWGVLKRFPNAFLNSRKQLKQFPIEKNYIYFQEFMPENKFDTRITVIGERAFGFTRGVRKNDFRASGSGLISYEHARINPQCIKIAFETARRIGSQSLAFDFVDDSSKSPKILEISYCFNAQAVWDCPGHWDYHHNWHNGHLWPQDAILEDLLSTVN